MSGASAERVSSRAGRRDRQRDGDRQHRGEGGGRGAGVPRLPDRGPGRPRLVRGDGVPAPARRPAEPRTSSASSTPGSARVAAIPEPLVELCSRRSPRSVHPMDVLRTSVSVLSHFDPEVNAPPTDHAANVRKAERHDRPDGDGDRLPRADRQGPAADRAPRRPRPRGQLPPHGQRQGPVRRRCARRSTSRWSSTPSTS